MCLCTCFLYYGVFVGGLVAKVVQLVLCVGSVVVHGGIDKGVTDWGRTEHIGSMVIEGKGKPSRTLNCKK